PLSSSLSCPPPRSIPPPPLFLLFSLYLTVSLPLPFSLCDSLTRSLSFSSLSFHLSPPSSLSFSLSLSIHVLSSLLLALCPVIALNTIVTHSTHSCLCVCVCV